MKNRVFAFAAAVLVLAACSKAYDDSALTGRLDKVEADVEAAAALLESYQSQIDDYKTLIQAYTDGFYVSSVESVMEGEAVVGYRIMFPQESGFEPIEIMNGADGAPGSAGSDGHSLKLGVVLVDGVYKWTVDGVATDMNASPDVAGLGIVNGETPQITIENGKWMMTVGDTKTELGDVSATDAVVGDDIFGSVEQADDVLKVTLWNGTEVEFPMVQDYGVAVDPADGAWTYDVSGYFVSPSLSVLCPYGWTAAVEPDEDGMTGRISLTAPADVAAGEYTFNVLVTDGVHSASTVFTVTVNEEGGLE